jgi:hypothetical protein
MSGPNPENEAVLAGVARALGLPDGASLSSLRPSGLWKMTQRDLLEVARVLGLTKVSRLNKQALLARVWEELERLGAIPANGASEGASANHAKVTAEAAARGRAARAQAAGPGAVAKPPPAAPVPAAVAKPVPPPPVPEEPGETPEETPPAAAHKFDVGQEPVRDLKAVRARAEATIPWSYGRDRVTAMPVDPERLCVYWEVTDEAISRARAGLGPGGPDAWLSLRVYDVTGRLFDGNNAHSYFDSRVERHDRQWFFVVGKPTSHVIVEVGLKSYEGYFVKIARSGRVEFPRREAVPWSEPEWMMVRVGTGEIGGTSYGSPAGAPAGGPPPGSGFEAGPPGWESLGQDLIAGVRRRLREGRYLVAGELHEEREVWEEGGLTDLEPEVSYGWSWESDREVASWTAGPFSYPVEAPALVRESYAGTARTFRTNGRTHIVWGPWQVVIRGVGAHAEQRVIAQWELYRSWTTSGWREVQRQVGDGPPGSSEHMVGASERWGRSGSELRLMGASERFAIGASELRMLGASERWFMGASEWLMRGASERRWSGASEWRFLGASEKMWMGASERRFVGASERRLGGASERLGASEQRLGASEQRLGASEQRLGGAGEQLISGGQEPDYRSGTVWPQLSSDKSG